MIALLLAAQLAATMPSDSQPSAAPTPTQGRPKAVEVGDWYARRLTLHRRTAYAIIPLFGFQALAGKQIWDKGTGAPTWARNGHRAGATAIAGAFTVNVVTGVWNLLEARGATEGRGRRYLHAASMMAATAGFTYAGAYLSNEAETSIEARKQHRIVALSSIGLTAVSGIMMKILND